MKEYVDIVKDIGGLGLLVLFLLAVARYLVPKLDKWFDKHFGLVDTLQAKLDGIAGDGTANAHGHATTQRALEHVAEAVHAAAPPDRRSEVRPHVDAAKNTLR